MDRPFTASEAEVEALDRVTSEVEEIQRELVRRHPRLTRPDRAAHQQQIAAGIVMLDVAETLPPELDGLGLFEPRTRARGIGRISTGMGCPHIETDPDFLGIMLAFQTRDRHRVDFLGINHPGAPTDTAEEFIALLHATSRASGTKVPLGEAGELHVGNLAATQIRLFLALAKRVGLWRATHIYAHVARQTFRTVRSSSAAQPYWTGIVEAAGVPGKFAFFPDQNVNVFRSLRPGPRHLTGEWTRRVTDGDIVFRARWIPFRTERETPLRHPRRTWSEEGAVTVGRLTFLQADPRTAHSRLLALLAAEMGANPGNWVSTRGAEPRSALPGTRFTAARALAYARGQHERDALAPTAYQGFFDTGSIGPDLAIELERRAALGQGNR